jgi:LmbE family N-acetylglucosaminyl deacetylase
MISRLRELGSDLPVAVLTGHATVDRVVTALRQSVAEFIQKPVERDEFVARARALVEEGRRARAAAREVVLAIGAHPDDVEIGAAGTLLAHRAGGGTVAILTLSPGAAGAGQERRATAAHQAAEVIGARLFLDDLEDSGLQEGDPTIGAIDRVIAEVQPTIVYTHSVHDVHQDHRNTHRAVMVAARQADSIFCFQSPSATVDFRPTRFVPIEGHLEGKLEAIRAFDAQSGIRDYLDPGLITSTARYWSRFCGGRCAEPFEAVRDRAAAALPPDSATPR